MRKRPAIAVMTWLVASKKKNCYDELWSLGDYSVRHTLEIMKVLTSMTMLLATTDARAMMFRPRKTLRMM